MNKSKSFKTLKASVPVEEKKEVKEEKSAVVKLSQPMSGGIRGLLSPNTTYKFRLVIANVINSNAVGLAAGYFNFDPSGTTEWTQLTALFDEVRGVANHLTIINQNPHYDGFATGDVKSSWCIASDAGKNSSVPSSVAVVADNPDSKLYSMASPRPIRMVYNYPKNLNYASTTSPASAPDIGCYGQWEWYSGNLTASVLYATTLQEFFLEFRNRT